MPLTRREFLTQGIQVAALGLVAPAFLVKAAYALSGAGSPAAAVTTPGAAGGSGGSLPDARARNILVVVQLSGGNDGLGTVIPYGDPEYYRVRPHLAVPKDQVLPLTDRMGLHPSLAQMQGLYQRGRLAVLESVGYPNPNRSHFRAMEIWQTAQPDVTEPTGWLGRMLAGDDCEDATCRLRGLNVGSSLPRTLYTETTIVPSLTNARSYQFRADGRFARDADAQSAAIHDLCSAPADAGVEEYVRLAALDALDSAGLLQQIVGDVTPDQAGAGSPLADALALVAKVIAADVGARVFYVSQGGFDTHALQARAHQRLLQDLDAALGSFYTTLEQSGWADRVLLMTFSEFGRRVAENASQGTDHGTALPMFLLGGGVRGGFYGSPPDLTALVDGDLIQPDGLPQRLQQHPAYLDARRPGRHHRGQLPAARLPAGVGAGRRRRGPPQTRRQVAHARRPAGRRCYLSRLDPALGGATAGREALLPFLVLALLAAFAFACHGRAALLLPREPSVPPPAPCGRGYFTIAQPARPGKGGSPDSGAAQPPRLRPACRSGTGARATE